MNRKAPLFILLPFLAVVLSCNLTPAGATLNPNDIQTLSAQTVAAVQTQAGGGSGLPGETAPADTLSPMPTYTDTLPPTSTATYTPTFTPTITPTPIPCNWAQFVTDVTFPDNSEIGPGFMVEKTWRLRNIGTCTWTSGYQIIFDHGDRMGAPDALQLTPGTVPPGGTVDVTVPMTSPAAEGTYQGYFRLRAPDSRVFGIGATADGAFWIKLKVVFHIDFTASFSGVNHCGDFYTTMFSLGNAGNVGLESAQIRLTNRTYSGQIGSTYTSDSPFLPTAASCLPGQDGPIGPGSAWWLGINVFPAMIPPLSELDIRAYIKLCTQEGLGGICVEKQVDFNYP
jgi:hypothetical protein